MEVESSGASSVDTSKLAADEQPAKDPSPGPVSPEDSMPGFLKLSRAGKNETIKKNKNLINASPQKFTTNSSISNGSNAIVWQKAGYILPKTPHSGRV